MARMIDADALKKELAPQNDWSWGNGTYVRDMIDAMPTVGGWISVKDRLPEENGVYLVFVARGYVEFYTLLDKTWFSSTFNICDDGFVTHWKPLPEPPKEEDDEQ